MGADQGLFTYVFLVRLDAYRTSQYCPIATKLTRGECSSCPMPVRHFWASDKPWWLHYTRCLEYFSFLDRRFETVATRCETWLQRRRELARSLSANWTCGGVQQCVF